MVIVGERVTLKGVKLGNILWWYLDNSITEKLEIRSGKEDYDAVAPWAHHGVKRYIGYKRLVKYHVSTH